jgi:hypothetical protein
MAIHMTGQLLTTCAVRCTIRKVSRKGGCLPNITTRFSKSKHPKYNRLPNRLLTTVTYTLLIALTVFQSYRPQVPFRPLFHAYRQSAYIRLKMPRNHLSFEERDIKELKQELSEVSDQRCRELLLSLIHDRDEVREACRRIFDPPKVVELNTWTYYDTEIHNAIVDGYATRPEVEAWIEAGKRSSSETMIILLVEIGIDLVARQSQWQPTDLDALHSIIQTELLKVLEEEVWLVSIAWERMDQLIKDNNRYSLLSAKVDEDRRNGKERMPPRQPRRSWDEALGCWDRDW